jgi:hypothetical protein
MRDSLVRQPVNGRLQVLLDFSALPERTALPVYNARLQRLLVRLGPGRSVQDQRPRFARAMRLPSAAAPHGIQVLVLANRSARDVARKARVPALRDSLVPEVDRRAQVVGLRLAFRNVPVALVRVARIRLLLAASVPVQLARGFQKPSQENLCMRASRPLRAAVRSWKSVSLKANANFIRCARVLAQVQVDALFWPSR